MRNVCSCVLLLAATASLTKAEVDPLSGIDFARVDAIGNRGYDGPDPQGIVADRGSVGYEYNIGRLEITTAQWMEYVNAFTARADAVPFSQIGQPAFWGATVDSSYTGPGTRYRLGGAASAELLPVGGLSWRQAAMYCNWLHNEKSANLSARLDGAYDASTFGFSSPGVFTDQATHHPGARYWIPTLDEWIKAVHFDPIASGPNGELGRWWLQPNGTDTVLNYGPPGQGQANSGFELPNNGHWRIPLGNYASVVSPWGLMDAAGGTVEWIEDVFLFDSFTYRFIDGTGAGLDSIVRDEAGRFAAEFPQLSANSFGIRIASAVPSPGVLAAFGMSVVHFGRRRRSCVHGERHSPP